MKNILGIVCSPRILGNSEIMVKEISNQLEEPHRLNLLRLTDFDIKPCRACYKCLFKDERCILQDDLYTVLDAIAEADALILSVPTYFLGPSSILKRLLDRGLSFYAMAESLWNKPALGIAIAGLYAKEGHALLGIESFLKLLLADIKKTKVVYGALPGEVFLNQERQELVQDLANSLFTSPTDFNGNPLCPVCGSNTFRFLGNNHIQCMLCSNKGKIKISNNVISFDISPSEHELFLNRDTALQHKEWLQNKVYDFFANKDSLKQIWSEYKDTGNWIRPARNSIEQSGKND